MRNPALANRSLDSATNASPGPRQKICGTTRHKTSIKKVIYILQIHDVCVCVMKSSLFTLIYFDNQDHDPCRIKLHSVCLSSKQKIRLIHALCYCTQNRGKVPDKKRQFWSKPLIKSHRNQYLMWGGWAVPNTWNHQLEAAYHPDHVALRCKNKMFLRHPTLGIFANTNWP